MRGQPRSMSFNKARTIVRRAMKVIVDYMLGEYLDKESYQAKYNKVSAVDDAVISALALADSSGDKTVHELYLLAKNIKAWKEDHISFFCGDPCPQRWMFKTMI